MSYGEMAYFGLVLFGFGAFIAGLGFVSTWSRSGQKLSGDRHPAATTPVEHKRAA